MILLKIASKVLDYKKTIENIKSKSYTNSSIEMFHLPLVFMDKYDKFFYFTHDPTNLFIAFVKNDIISGLPNTSQRRVYNSIENLLCK